MDVIDVMVKPGDKLEKEQGLITLETDKAAMDVPSPYGGTVKQLKIKKGDKVSEGTLILTMEVAESAAFIKKDSFLPPHPHPRQLLPALPYLLRPCSRLPQGERE